MVEGGGGGGAAASFAFEQALPWRRAVCSSSKRERLHVRQTQAKWPAVRSYPLRLQSLALAPTADELPSRLHLLQLVAIVVEPLALDGSGVVLGPLCRRRVAPCGARRPSERRRARRTRSPT